MLSERLKQLRTEKGITQIQLAEMLGVSKGTVAMWETDKRNPGFDILFELSNIFDRRIDYILGHSDDASSPNPTEEELEDMGRSAATDIFCEIIMNYLRLDEYGKHAVESVIAAEFNRCREQESLFPENEFQFRLRLRK